MAVDERVKPCRTEDRDIDDTVGCIRVKVSPDNRYPELCRGIMHPFHHQFLHGGLGNREYIDHRDGVTAHCCDIVNIDEH